MPDTPAAVGTSLPNPQLNRHQYHAGYRLAGEAPQFSIVRVFDAPCKLGFHLFAYEGKPGEGFVYDDWDEALMNFGRHPAGE